MIRKKEFFKLTTIVSCLAIILGFSWAEAEVCNNFFINSQANESKLKIRQHRGGLKESMETVEEINSTMNSIALSISTALGFKVAPNEIEIKPYAYDGRIDWDTYIVTINGWGIYGFTDGPVFLKN